MSLRQETREILDKYSLTLKKSLGQNFLVDEHVLSKIITSSEINENDYVVEIGPGIGTLTKALCENAGFVNAFEIDKSLIPVLEHVLSGYKNIEIINDDALKVDFGEYINAFAGKGYKSAKVVANLPYYITTPIIMRFLESELRIKSITVMVQKEVAERMCAKAGTKDFGALTLAVNYYAKPYIAAYVPVNCFIPRPNVDSAVIRLDVLDKPPVAVSDKKLLFAVIKAAFSMRRKTLLNCLASSFGVDKAQMLELLVESGLDEKTRGETLGLSEFAEVTKNLVSSKCIENLSIN